MDRIYCEQEVVKVINDYQNEPLNLSDYYRVKTVELLASITDEKYIRKIYNYALGFTLEQL